MRLILCWPLFVVAGLVVGDDRRQGKQGHDGQDTEKGDVDGKHKRFGLMNIF